LLILALPAIVPVSRGKPWPAPTVPYAAGPGLRGRPLAKAAVGRMRNVGVVSRRIDASVASKPVKPTESPWPVAPSR